jgi:hypothetical protein
LLVDPGKDYRVANRKVWDDIAARLDSWEGLGRYYHRRLAEIYRFLIPPGSRVLEIGCARGDLLDAVSPSYGVGVDHSLAMICRAQARHPRLNFICADADDLCINGPFDSVILSDLVNDLWDVERTFNEVARVSDSRTRIIINTYSRLWELPLSAAARLGLARPRLGQNWLAVPDIENLLRLSGFETISHWSEFMWPLRTPLLAPLMNRGLVKLWPLRHLGLANFIVARPVSSPAHEAAPTVSVIVPARNEAGNIAAVFARTPELGGGTELIFVEGHSSDDTHGTIERAIAGSSRDAKLLRQSGVGKGDAVRMGFEHAKADILMILDADLTVAPEELPRFYNALRANRGEFINGVRLVYPMEAHAMRFLNLLGNKFFSQAFSWMLGQPVKDTLCGTKVLWRRDYLRIARNRQHFGEFDPFGDFDLLFGAAKLNLKIVDMPIRYRERTYGTTNIQRWRHGRLLLAMLWFGARRLKFQ